MTTQNAKRQTPNAKGFAPSFLTEKNSSHRERAGFTLVEVIVSMVIVAITAVGIFASFIATQNYVSRSRGRIMAINAERAELERLRAEVNQGTWDNTPNCNPDVNELAVTRNITANTGMNCPTCNSPSTLVSGGDGWTCWENFVGTFGGPPWNGRRRYRVFLVNPADPNGPRQTEFQLNWTEPGG